MGDGRLRWNAYWALDQLTGARVRQYYEQIKGGYCHGTSMEETDHKIRQLIRHAVRTTAFYQDFGEDTALADLPVVDKNVFRSRYQDFLSETYRDARGNRTMFTSGSTGTPLSMLQDQNKIRHNTAAGIFLGALGGYYIGMKQAFIRVWVNNVQKSTLRLVAENQIMMDSSSLDEASMAQMLSVIRKKKVQSLVGYSSALCELSRYIREQQVDLSDSRVVSIIPISESMPPKMRQQLKQQFHCPVQAWYSNEENGIMAIQLPDSERYYVDSESYYYEILKLDSDRPAAPGELGRIVITDLYNYAFPILRYDNGDLAIARREEKNGRYHLFLTQLYGRRSDMLYDCRGKAVTPYVITNNLWDVAGVRQFRFIQEGPAGYTLQLNADRGEIDVGQILDRIRPYLGDEAEIGVEFVDEIPVLNSGKRKYIENRWKGNQ